MATAQLNPHFKSVLLRHMRSKSTLSNTLLQRGFTLVELMIVIVIVGILSAVAIPQFMKQTKKAVATEATSQNSSIIKQASSANQEEPITTVDATCADYAGTLPATSKFTYACSGTAAAFVVTATGKANTNAAGITVAQTANLDTGVIAKQVITGT